MTWINILAIVNKYTNILAKGSVFKVDLEYSKELRELHNDYPLVPDKIEIKRKMLSEYELKITDLYDIPISSIKKISAWLFLI